MSENKVDETNSSEADGPSDKQSLASRFTNANLRLAIVPFLDNYVKSCAWSSDPPSTIIPGFLYLGDASSSAWLPHLIDLSITHVINLAGSSNFWESSETIKQEFQRLSMNKQTDDKLKVEASETHLNSRIDGTFTDEHTRPLVDSRSPSFLPPKYLKIRIADMPSARISEHFDGCIKFIESAKENGGRVLVHCQAGVSRSTSIVIAFLMHSQRISYEQAFCIVKQKRQVVKPNAGFVRQLREFEVSLCIEKENMDHTSTMEQCILDV
ncbi:5153_t:CDS:1 [Paraglomus brasilianum]|uniref:protein-tyrosine-phosphatase n=1 Tax=Paraglomus brasilianum TaxID=144538 RepID=A0A9N9C9B2_9GLOM|nr:5153_t:CDS:1 [Paraglomus brasilianum]